MGSTTFDGVRFVFWSNDHDPLHVHGLYAGVELVLDLYRDERRVVASREPNPSNAKRSDVAHIARTANRNIDILVTMAEEIWQLRNQSSE